MDDPNEEELHGTSTAFDRFSYFNEPKFNFKSSSHLLKRSSSLSDSFSIKSSFHRTSERSYKLGHVHGGQGFLSLSCPALNSDLGLGLARRNKGDDKKLFLNEILKFSPRILDNFSSEEGIRECVQKPVEKDAMTELSSFDFCEPSMLFVRDGHGNNSSSNTLGGSPLSALEDCVTFTSNEFREEEDCCLSIVDHCTSPAQSNFYVTDRSTPSKDEDWDLDYTATEARVIQNRLNAILNSDAGCGVLPSKTDVPLQAQEREKPFRDGRIHSNSIFINGKAVITSQYYRYSTKKDDNKPFGERSRSSGSHGHEGYTCASAPSAGKKRNKRESLFTNSHNDVESLEINEMLIRNSPKIKTYPQCATLSAPLDSNASLKKSPFSNSKTTKRPKFKTRDDTKSLKTEKKNVAKSQTNPGLIEIKFSEESLKKKQVPEDRELLSSRRLRQYRISQAFRVLAALNSNGVFHGIENDACRSEKIPLHIYVPAAVSKGRPSPTGLC